MPDRIPSINPGGQAGQQIFARRQAFNQVTSNLATAGAAAQNPQAPVRETPAPVKTDKDAQSLQSQSPGIRRAVQSADLQQIRQDLVGQFIQDVSGELTAPGAGERAGGPQGRTEPPAQNIPGQRVVPEVPGQGVSDQFSARDLPGAAGDTPEPTGFESANASGGSGAPVVDTFSVTETTASVGGGVAVEDVARTNNAPAPRRPEENISRVPGGASRGAIVDVVA
ncbi:MAG: hypothetical protein O2807_09380 [bacterium]|nr:hypothetical protein [bacterium]